MTGNEIATRADIEQIHQRLDNLFTILSGMQSNTSDRELTLDQAAAFLSVSTATVKRWLNDGRLKNKGTVNKKRFSENELTQLKKVKLY